MTDKLRQAAEHCFLAFDAIFTAEDRGFGIDYIKGCAESEAIRLRQALDELPDTTKMIDTGTDRGAWADVSDATKWVDELRGEDDIDESSNYNLIIHALTELHNKTPHEDGNGSALIYLDEAVNVIEKIEALDEPPKPIGEIVEAHGLIAVSIPEMPPAGTKLYAEPPKSEWVGLTEEEIAEVGKFTTEGEHMLPYSFACAIEAKLKEKNNG